MAGDDDPVQVFHKLFSADDMPLEQRQAAIAEKRSVLDAVAQRGEASAAMASRAKIQTKLDEYFQGIRDIETRLSKDEAWLEVPEGQGPSWRAGPRPEGESRDRDYAGSHCCGAADRHVLVR